MPDKIAAYHALPVLQISDDKVAGVPDEFGEPQRAQLVKLGDTDAVALWFRDGRQWLLPVKRDALVKRLWHVKVPPEWRPGKPGPSHPHQDGS